MMLENERLQLVPADVGLAEQAADYYRRNRAFLQRFDPAREEAFFTAAHQKEVLERETDDWRQKKSYRFYIRRPERPDRLIGIIGLNNVVWGAFCSAFLGYKLDEEWVNRGYMSQAISMVTDFAFTQQGLHRIEANVLPDNRASLRVLEKNGYKNEGLSKFYLKINGVWQDHIHMVRINYAMHD